MTTTLADAVRTARSLVFEGCPMDATRVLQQALGITRPAIERAAAPGRQPAFDGPTLDLAANTRSALLGSVAATSGPPRRPAAAAEKAGAPPFASRRPPRVTPDNDARKPVFGAMLRGGGLARARRSPALPDGARFDAFTHAGPYGTRAYKLYVPAAPSVEPRPLVVMLHGCTQDPDDFALGTRMNEVAEALGVLVVYPEQDRRANPSACWRWFERAHQGRGSGEPAIIAGIVGEVAARFAVDGARVFAAGLSAGGAMAAILGDTYPDVFSGVGVHSGLPVGAASDVSSAFRAMRDGGSKPAGRSRVNGPPSRLIVFHGTSDKTVHPANGEQLAGRQGEQRRPSLKHGAINGRRYTRTALPGTLGTSSVEYWQIENLAHAWSGGDPDGSFADPAGPDASREMMRFFLEG